MSQDLFAAFGDDTQSHSTSRITTSSAQQVPSWLPQHDVSQRIVPITIDNDDDDDFGDFEDAEAAAPAQAPVHRAEHHSTQTQAPSSSRSISRSSLKTKPLPFAPKAKTEVQDPSVGRHPFADHMDILFSADDDEYDAGQDEWNDLSNNPEAAMAYSKQVIQAQLEAAEKVTHATERDIPQPKPQPAASHVSRPETRSADVLFDAEDLSPDEQSEQDQNDDWGDFEDSNAQAAPTSTITKEVRSSAPSVDLLGLDITSDETTTASNKLSTKPTPSPSKISVKTSPPVIEDPWDDFDDTVEKSTANIAPNRLLPEVPPTNIPPPSVLLSEISTSLKITPTADSIDGLVQTAWVAAHVVAGRKLRWKRSASLAASMRIGPAGSSKGGMKLAGVDRTETAKEDREVAEVLTVWRAKVGKLRTAATAHHTPGPSKPKVLDLAETMPIRALKSAEGGFTAAHECTLCGLKREERIVKIDGAVDDSFGEWWTEGASMHTTCAEWWVNHEKSLRSR